MFPSFRRAFVVAVALSLSSFAIDAANAYPDQPIKIIVTFPPGGSSDIVIRALQPLLSETLRQSIVVENRAGASGMLGLKQLASAKPDGYTIGQIPISVVSFSQLGTVNLEPLKELDYLARVSGQTFGIAVPAAAVRVPQLHWTECGDGFQCATARVPLDYDRPRGAQIS